VPYFSPENSRKLLWVFVKSIIMLIGVTSTSYTFRLIGVASTSYTFQALAFQIEWVDYITTRLNPGKRSCANKRLCIYCFRYEAFANFRILCNFLRRHFFNFLIWRPNVYGLHFSTLEKFIFRFGCVNWSNAPVEHTQMSSSTLQKFIRHKNRTEIYSSVAFKSTYKIRTKKEAML